MIIDINLKVLTMTLRRRPDPLGNCGLKNWTRCLHAGEWYLSRFIESEDSRTKSKKPMKKFLDSVLLHEEKIESSGLSDGKYWNFNYYHDS